MIATRELERQAIIEGLQSYEYVDPSASQFEVVRSSQAMSAFTVRRFLTDESIALMQDMVDGLELGIDNPKIYEYLGVTLFGDTDAKMAFGVEGLDSESAKDRVKTVLESDPRRLFARPGFAVPVGAPRGSKRGGKRYIAITFDEETQNELTDQRSNILEAVGIEVPRVIFPHTTLIGVGYMAYEKTDQAAQTLDGSVQELDESIEAGQDPNLKLILKTAKIKDVGLIKRD